jgi:hypothetical protein
METRKAQNNEDNRATVMLGQAPVLTEPLPEEKKATIAEEESRLDLSSDFDFSTMDELPALPAEMPQMNTKEYKNYMKLKYEMTRRNPELVAPASSPPPA